MALHFLSGKKFSRNANKIRRGPLLFSKFVNFSALIALAGSKIWSFSRHSFMGLHDITLQKLITKVSHSYTKSI